MCMGGGGTSGYGGGEAHTSSSIKEAVTCDLFLSIPITQLLLLILVKKIPYFEKVLW